MQRRVLELVVRIHVGAVLQEDLGGLGPVVRCGLVHCHVLAMGGEQGEVLARVAAVDIRACRGEGHHSGRSGACSNCLASSLAAGETASEASWRGQRLHTPAPPGPPRQHTPAAHVALHHVAGSVGSHVSGGRRALPPPGQRSADRQDIRPTCAATATTVHLGTRLGVSAYLRHRLAQRLPLWRR